MNERRYVIDIGTNSVRLMRARVEEGRIIREYKETRTVRPGEGVHFTHRLSEAAIDRTVAALCELCGQIRDEGGSSAACFATSAVRDAENAQDFIRRVEEACGLRVEILSGDEEAACGYAGAVGSGDGGILDIGGGSTEVIFGRGGEIFYAHSFNVGCVRALDLFPGDESATLDWAQEQLKSVPFWKSAGLPFYTVGGTATSLAAISQQLKKYDPARVDGFVLSRPLAEELFARLRGMDVEARRALDGMAPRRAEIITYGLAILLAFFAASGRGEVIVREADNLEGYLLRHAPRG